MEILDLKMQNTEIKESVEGFFSIINPTEENISKLYYHTASYHLNFLFKK
jgi:hypothetical protein